MMEKAGSPEDSRLDDAIGFVKTRKRLNETQFLSRFTDEDLSRFPLELIRRQSGSLEWNLFQSSRNRILNIFLEQISLLNAAQIVGTAERASQIVLIGDVIDRQRMSIERLAAIVSADNRLSGILFHLVRSEDAGIMYQHFSDVHTSFGDSTQGSRASLRWLSDMSLVARRDGTVHITHYGLEKKS